MGLLLLNMTLRIKAEQSLRRQLAIGLYLGFPYKWCCQAGNSPVQKSSFSLREIV